MTFLSLPFFLLFTFFFIFIYVILSCFISFCKVNKKSQIFMNYDYYDPRGKPFTALRLVNTRFAQLVAPLVFSRLIVPLYVDPNPPVNCRFYVPTKSTSSYNDWYEHMDLLATLNLTRHIRRITIYVDDHDSIT